MEIIYLLVPLSLVLIIVFGFLYVRDRAAGGYAVERIESGEA